MKRGQGLGGQGLKGRDLEGWGLEGRDPAHPWCVACRAEAFRRGGRPGAQKVMIVITDGESHDSPQLQQAVADSERDNVTMYAIAVSRRRSPRGGHQQ